MQSASVTLPIRGPVDQLPIEEMRVGVEPLAVNAVPGWMPSRPR